MMNCHEACGACCIAPHISSPLPNMPNGKPAGVRCINLDEQNRCTVYDQRPSVCRNFTADRDTCGSNFEEALVLISELESATTTTTTTKRWWLWVILSKSINRWSHFTRLNRPSQGITRNKKAPREARLETANKCENQSWSVSTKTALITNPAAPIPRAANRTTVPNFPASDFFAKSQTI